MTGIAMRYDPATGCIELRDESRAGTEWLVAVPVGATAVRCKGQGTLYMQLRYRRDGREWVRFCICGNELRIGSERPGSTGHH